jgi:hypothetical protein
MHLLSVNCSYLTEQQATLVENVSSTYNEVVAAAVIRNHKMKILITKELNSLFMALLSKKLPHELCSHLALFAYAMVVPGKHEIAEQALREACTKHWEHSKHFVRGLRMLYNTRKQNCVYKIEIE